MSFIAKLASPSFYTGAVANMTKRAQNYYHPLIRQNSMTPLWHSMMAISVIMYTATYTSRVYPEIQAKRATEREAMAEYYAKHGGAAHH